MDAMQAADILISKVRQDYRDDVAVIVMMGSRIYGDIHDRSDLDLYYVPNTERGKDLGFTFIIDGIGFDFWPITWERLERIARREERITSIITEGRILYSRSDEDLARFDTIRQIARKVPEDAERIRQADQRLAESYRIIWRVSQAEGLSTARRQAIALVYSLTDTLALLNGIPIKRGRGRLKGEITAMPLVPAGFADVYDCLFTACTPEQLTDACRLLLIGVENCVRQEQERLRQPVQFRQVMHGFYEELINCYNKIEHACAIGDHVTALFAAAELSHELDEACLGTGVTSDMWPDLVADYHPDQLPDFLVAARKHQQAIESLLAARDVTPLVFADFTALKTYLDQRG